MRSRILKAHNKGLSLVVFRQTIKERKWYNSIPEKLRWLPTVFEIRQNCDLDLIF
jgi:hypothetical protein